MNLEWKREFALLNIKLDRLLAQKKEVSSSITIPADASEVKVFQNEPIAFVPASKLSKRLKSNLTEES